MIVINIPKVLGALPNNVIFWM